MSIEQIRPVLLIALAFVALLMWQAWQRDYGPKRQPAPAAVTSTEADIGTEPSRDVPIVPEPADDAAAAQAPSAADGAAAQAPSADVPGGAPAPASGAVVRVTTDLMEAEISLKGGTLHRLRLLQYPISLEDHAPITLLDDSGPIFVAQSGLIGRGEAPNHHAAYTAEHSEYRLEAGQDEVVVRLRWKSDALSVVKTYRFERDSYVVNVSYEVTNRGAEPWTGRMYGQFRRSAPHQSRGLGKIYTYTGGVLSSPEKPYEKVDFDDVESQAVDRDVRGGWTAMIQHYFGGAWIPPQDRIVHYYSKAFSNEQYVLGVVGPPVEIAPERTDELALKLYVGPKIQERMKAAAPGLERTVDYGWLFFIAEPLYMALQFIHRLLGNWGWSIIVLTFFIKLAFFPLSNASYKSMARMRKLQPKVKTLKERFGDDRQKLNQAMMDLYKKEKINPLGGCLPIVVQIPVFISLYWVLLETVELRQAPFMFWLKDLSTHDPFYVLPLLMGISMFVQQRLSPAPPDPIQAKVMMAMPIVFTFFFLFFPSGLVLYWLVNNLLSITQQWAITRRIESGKQS